METGVFDGLGTSFILQALMKNKTGTLISVDLPATKVIKGSTDLMPFQILPKNGSPGWLLSETLKKRWKLILINKRRGLGDILKKIPSIDIFLHDSLHTKEHMSWEMNLAWSKLKKRGMLLVDDVYCNRAFKEFSVKNKRIYMIKYGLGVMKK